VSAVIEIELWPSMRETWNRLAPSAIARLAAVWRSSWNL
jgi:hypothetical protein